MYLDLGGISWKQGLSTHCSVSDKRKGSSLIAIIPIWDQSNNVHSSVLLSVVNPQWSHSLPQTIIFDEQKFENKKKNLEELRFQKTIKPYTVSPSKYTNAYTNSLVSTLSSVLRSEAQEIIYFE